LIYLLKKFDREEDSKKGESPRFLRPLFIIPGKAASIIIFAGIFSPLFLPDEENYFK